MFFLKLKTSISINLIVNNALCLIPIPIWILTIIKFNRYFHKIYLNQKSLLLTDDGIYVDVSAFYSK